MASTYVNDLRLNEMATGDASGTWGTTTNTNLELIGEALGYGTEGITTNADTHTSTIADGATDPVRAMYVKYTGTLDSACTITIAPNTVNRMQFIENGTSGSQNIIISQGSGANITIPPGDTKAVYLDGAGSGAAVVDAFASLSVVDLKVQDDLTVTDDLIVNGDIDLEGAIDVNGTSNLDVVDIDGAVNMATTALVTGVLTTTAATVFNGGFASNADSTMGTDKKVQFRDAAIYINSSADGQLDLVADTEIQIAATTIDINGAINASGEIIAASLDISGNVDIDGVLETDNLTVGGAQGTDGQVLTSTGSGVGWEDASGGATDINGLSDAKTFGTSSLMLGDATTGTIDAANYNTGVGVDVFAALTSGDNNTAIGFAALDANTEGHSNTALGSSAGSAITTGDYNVAIGRNSLDACTTADNNVAVGWTSLGATTTGASNTAVGGDSMAANTTGTLNVAVGTATLDANTEGERNTALGIEALGANTTGGYNTACGERALDANTTASQNTAVGSEAGGGNTTGTANVFMGFQAGDNVTTGSYNTIIGHDSGNGITTGPSNVLIGASVADGGTTIEKCVMIGRLATQSATNSDSQIVIGYNATGKGDSTGFISPSGGAVYQGNNATAWAQTSDRRIKKNIVDNNVGLDVINKIRVRNFEYRTLDEIVDFDNPKSAVVEQEGIQLGAIAQELEDFLPEVVETTSEGVKSVTADRITWHLVNAVQELTAQVETLKTEISTLKGE